MSDREKRVVWNEALDVDEEGYTISLVVEVYYSRGGENFITYKSDLRGYYLSVSIDRVKVTPTMTSHKFGLFDGQRLKTLLATATRFSEKTLVSHAKDVADNIHYDRVEAMKAQVLDKYREEQKKKRQSQTARAG
jgi:hypothetical protein